MRFVLYITIKEKDIILGRFWTIQKLLVSKNYSLAVKKIQKYNDKVDIFLHDDILNQTYKIGQKEINKDLVMNELEIRSKI